MAARMLLVSLAGWAAAAASADATAEFLAHIAASPPRLAAAQVLCERGQVGPTGASGPPVLEPPPEAAAVGARRLDHFLVALLPTWPEAMSLLACAVRQRVIAVEHLPDRGAALLQVAAARKHMRLTATLVQGGASYAYVAPRSAGGGGLLHAALDSRVAALDLAAKALRAGGAARRAALGLAGGDDAAAVAVISDGGGGGILDGAAASNITQWLLGVGGTVGRHLADVAPAEGKRVDAAVEALVVAVTGAPAPTPPVVAAATIVHVDPAAGPLPPGERQAPDSRAPPTPDATAAAAATAPAFNSTSLTVDGYSAAAVANGLSVLLARILLSSAQSAAGRGTSPAAAPPLLDGGDAPAPCSPAGRARALAASFAASPARALLVSVDRYGRSPLHVAAASGSVPAVGLLTRTLFETLAHELSGGVVDGGAGSGPPGRGGKSAPPGAGSGGDAAAAVDPLIIDGCYDVPPPTTPAHAPGGGGNSAPKGASPDAPRRDSPPGHAAAAAAVTRYLNLRDSLGATALETACAHGYDAVADALHAALGAYSGDEARQRSTGAGAASSLSQQPGGWERSAACKPVLDRLAGGGGVGATGVQPGRAPWVGAGKDASVDVDALVAAKDGGWPASPSNVPRAAVKAVRAARRRLVERLWAGNGSTKVPSINAAAAVEAFDAHCDAEVVDFSGLPAARLAERLTAHDFLARYAHASRPVLLRGLGGSWMIRTLWARDALLASAGHVPFTAYRIPYAKAFGAASAGGAGGGSGSSGGDGVRVTLGEYIRAMGACGGGSGSGSSAEGDDADDVAALCARLGYPPPGGRGAGEAAPDDLPLYVFDAPQPAAAAVQSNTPWSVQPTPPPAAGTCTTGCGKTLSSVMEKAWHTVADANGGGGAEILSSFFYQLHLFNASVPVDRRAASTLTPAVLAGAGVGAGAPTGVLSEGDDLNMADGGQAGSYEAGMADHTVLTQPHPPRPQFFLGPPGSGAPLHWHKDAWNYVAWGQKRWFLLPPSHAGYSTVPVAEWITRELPALDKAATAAGTGTRRGGSGGGGPRPEASTPPRPPPFRPLECTQAAGDVMFVPAGWAHAVLNTATSVGVAVEFTSPLVR